MAVYVDDMMAPYRNMVMCHMMADTTEELLEMADKIGLQRKWIQYKGLPKEHFDIALGTRKKAVRAGAQQVTMKFCGKLMLDRYAALRALEGVKP